MTHVPMTIFNTLVFHGFLPAHSLATRGDNCFDHIILRSKSTSVALAFETTVNDHYLSLFCIKVRKTKAPITTTDSKINFVYLDNKIAHMDFTPIFLTLDPNIATNALINLEMP